MYSPLRYVGDILWKTRPIHLTFFVTRRCNARCPFCFYLRQEGEPVHQQPELSLPEIEQLSASLGPLLWVAFSGGEVYLREDIVDITRTFYEHNKPTILLYSSNGLVPKLIRDRTIAILENCPHSVVAVKLSLDGLHADHDALRGVPGSFEKVLRTYQELSTLLPQYPNFELGINTVFCAANQDKIADIFEFVKGLEHIRTHTLSLIRGNLEEKDLKDVDLQKYQQAVLRLEKDLKQKVQGMYRFPGARLKTAQDILQRRLILRTVSEQRQMLPCYAGRLNLVLTESGDVYPCELLKQTFGNVKDYDYNLRKMLRSATARQIVRGIGANRCYCSHECYFMTNILFNPRMYPALLKEYLQL